MSTTLLRLASVLCFAALAACAGASPNDGLDLTGTGVMDGGGGTVCMPGSTKECACLGGGMGTKVCRASGQSYGSCGACMGAPDGSDFVQGDGGASPCGDCEGCCDGTSCVPFASETNAKCGTPGNDCASCGAKVCDTGSGQCVDAVAGCNAGNCSDGCCKMVNGTLTCQRNQQSACGTGGVSCTVACTPGTLCTGTCTGKIDPNYNFKVIVTGATFYNTDSSGACWDNNGFGFGCGQPDVFVGIAYKTGTTLSAMGQTTKKDNVAATSMPEDSPTALDVASWSDTDGLVKLNGQPFRIPGQAFLDGSRVLISIWDYDDVSSNELISSAYMSKITNVSTYDVGPFQRVTKITLKLQ